MEATVILMRCKKNKALSGIRVQKMEDDNWWMTWAFGISEKSAKNEGFSQHYSLKGMCGTSDYPGCPYCKSPGFVVCGNCNNLTCYDGEKNITCAWCGQHLDNIVISDKFELSGGGY